MTGLWTPDGERQTSAAPTDDDDPAPGSRRDGGTESPDAAELARLEEELLDTPAEDIVLNHCYGLFQLAALYLAQRPPRLEEARLSIDAFGAIVEQVGPRLGEGIDTLREGLSQVRLAFVEIAKAATNPPEPGE